MTFGGRLRELREAAGMTQVALAAAAGMSLGSVRNYEQGIREPYWQGVFRLAAALGVPCDAFAECAGAGPPVKAAAARPHATAGRTGPTQAKRARKPRER
jgi:transcriptional regulator with XRE-family HTH domain